MAQAVRRHLCGALRSQHSSAFAAPVRRFSATGAAAREENLKEAAKWRKITITGYVVVFCFGTYTLLNEDHHHKEQPAYSYLHIRNKEFPWGPNGLFETPHKHEHEHEHEEEQDHAVEE